MTIRIGRLAAGYVLGMTAALEIVWLTRSIHQARRLLREAEIARRSALLVLSGVGAARRARR